MPLAWQWRSSALHVGTSRPLDALRCISRTLLSRFRGLLGTGSATLTGCVRLRGLDPRLQHGRGEDPVSVGTERMRENGEFADGIPLADENLGASGWNLTLGALV
jgi:hypothetical protein